MEGNEFLEGGRGLYKVKQGKLGKCTFWEVDAEVSR